MKTPKSFAANCFSLSGQVINTIYKGLTSSTINMTRHALGGETLQRKFHAAGGLTVLGTGALLKGAIGLSAAATTMSLINKQRDMIRGGSEATTPRSILYPAMIAGGAGTALAASSLLRIPRLWANKVSAIKGFSTWNSALAGTALVGAFAGNWFLDSMRNPSAGPLSLLAANGPILMNKNPNSPYAYMSATLERGAALRRWEDAVWGKPGESFRGPLEKLAVGFSDTIFGTPQDLSNSYTLT